MMGLLAIAGKSSANDNLSVEDVTIEKNGTAKIEIILNSSDMNYGGFQFHLQLPSGITAVAIEKTDRLNGNGSGAEYSLKLENNNVLCYNDARMSIEGTTGAVARITLAADESTTVGSVLTAKLTDVVLSTVDLEQNDAEDAVFSITIGEENDGYLKFDENSATLPTYTAGEKGNVRMTRTIKAGIWNTIVLPFNLTKANAAAIFGENYQLAKFSNFAVDYGEDEENTTPIGITLNFISYTIPARGNLPGGTPILIKVEETIDSPFELTNVTLARTVTDVAAEDIGSPENPTGTTGKFTGSLVKATVPADGLFISDNKFWYSTGKTTIKAFRGWFELGAVLDKETDFGVKLHVMVDEDPTAVEGMSAEIPQGTIYDLSGRKLEKVPQKGIYLLNGKKILTY